MVDVRAALTRKIGPLPVVAWGAILGGGVLVAKMVGIGGGGGASGDPVTVGAGAAPVADGFDYGDGGGSGGSGGGLTPTVPIDIPGTIDDGGANAFFDWLLHAPGSIIRPPSGDTPGTIELPDPTPNAPGGSIVTPPSEWWDSVPQLPTITPAPITVPSQPAIPAPGVNTPPADAASSILAALVARVTFLRDKVPDAARSYRIANPLPSGTETTAARIARLTAEAAALAAARIKLLVSEVTTLRNRFPIAAAAYRKAHPIPASETAQEREHRLALEVAALRSATR